MAMSPRLLRPLASGFSPRSIAGLAWWLDAADTSTVTLNGSTVSAWGDKSGNARNVVQAVANNQPSYANSQNGRKVITFNGTSNRLATSAAYSLGTSGYTFMAVAFHGGGFHVLAEGGNLNPYISTDANGSIKGFKHYDGANGLDTGDGAYTTSTWFVLEVVVSAASRLIVVDGSLKVTGSGTSRTASFQNIGATSAGFFWGGRVAEVLVYSSALAATQRAAARNYLGSKWGVAVA
jgi:hypothetical protein